MEIKSEEAFELLMQSPEALHYFRMYYPSGCLLNGLLGARDECPCDMCVNCPEEDRRVMTVEVHGVVERGNSG